MKNTQIIFITMDTYYYILRYLLICKILQKKMDQCVLFQKKAQKILKEINYTDRFNYQKRMKPILM